jgi:hypothetical protein
MPSTVSAICLFANRPFAEPRALGPYAGSLAGRRHRASSGCGFPAPGTVTLDSATRSRHVAPESARIRWRRMSSEAADAAGGEVPEAAQAPRIGVGFVVVPQSPARARCLYPCMSASRESRATRRLLEGRERTLQPMDLPTGGQRVLSSPAGAPVSREPPRFHATFGRCWK